MGVHIVFLCLVGDTASCGIVQRRGCVSMVQWVATTVLEVLEMSPVLVHPSNRGVNY